jgi:hypothetical protein
LPVHRVIHRDANATVVEGRLGGVEGVRAYAMAKFCADLELGLWLKPGVTGGEIFERGRAHVSRYLNNFSREFVGHGIGIGSHEQPRMDRVNRTVLEPDSVVCIEYSYYCDGVRHHTEDRFLERADGVEHWTPGCQRELIVPG